MGKVFASLIGSLILGLIIGSVIGLITWNSSGLPAPFSSYICDANEQLVSHGESYGTGDGSSYSIVNVCVDQAGNIRYADFWQYMGKALLLGVVIAGPLFILGLIGALVGKLRKKSAVNNTLFISNPNLAGAPFAGGFGNPAFNNPSHASVNLTQQEIELLRYNRKNEAVKSLRERTGLDRAECKRIVETAESTVGSSGLW